MERLKNVVANMKREGDIRTQRIQEAGWEQRPEGGEECWRVLQEEGGVSGGGGTRGLEGGKNLGDGVWERFDEDTIFCTRLQSAARSIL